MNRKPPLFTGFATVLGSITFIAVAYLGSFTLACKLSTNTLPGLYRPMRYVFESRAAPVLQWYLERLNVEPNVVQCMLY
jgi:hypothetical protein